MEKEFGIIRKLSRLYIAALTVIAVLVISGQLLLQNALNRQIDDSRVVNIAGRQRMLSQKLAKEAMKLQGGQEGDSETLKETLQLWQMSYDGLLRGNASIGLPGKNSETVLQMFRDIEKPFHEIADAASRIVETSPQNTISERAVTAEAVNRMLVHEPLFLLGMNQIVFQYDKEAKSRVKHSKQIEQLLTWIALFVLLLEGFFVFRPAVRKLSNTLVHLKKERERTERLNEKLNQALKEILDISEQERRRIAQDLHDRLGQEISGMACLTKVLQKKLESRQAPESLDMLEVNQLMTQALSHSREIARGLYPIAIDGDGLVDKLKDLAASTEKIFRVQCRLTSPNRLSPVRQKQATHLYCIIQEAIRNSIRHGKAKCIRVSVYEKENSIGVSVSDDGVGFPPDQSAQGLGIRIMKYRSELIQGRLSFSKSESGGAAVTCEIEPAQDENDESA